MTAEKTVPNIETDQQILVARLLSWHRYPEFAPQVRAVLASLELAHLIPNPDRPFTVDLSEYIADVSKQAEITLHAPSGTPDAYNVSDAIARLLQQRTATIIRAIREGKLVAEAVEVDSDAVDVDAVIAAWGGNDTPYPRAGSEEVEAYRRQLVTDTLHHGVQHEYCRVLESTLRHIGLSAYLPPETKELVVDIPGFGPITVTAHLDRVGRVDDYRFKRDIAQHIIAELEKRGALTTTAA
ncbi:hypothetical protein ACW9HR_22105 [Nocardia gipuzkoensis]